MLVEYFIDRYARKTGKKIRTIEKRTLELSQSYSWPGNIRELQNIVERTVIVCETETFSVDHSWLSRSFSALLARCDEWEALRNLLSRGHEVAQVLEQSYEDDVDPSHQSRRAGVFDQAFQ